MTDLPKAFREVLSGKFAVADPRLLEVVGSSDGSQKYLMEFADGVAIEGVSMLEGLKATFCLSSQAGCAVGCTFCVTGALGAGRNLTPQEIVGQYRLMLRDLDDDIERVNLVFMGMGEPLLNTGNLETRARGSFGKSEPQENHRLHGRNHPRDPVVGRARSGARSSPSLSMLPTRNGGARSCRSPSRYPLDALFAELRAFPLERGGESPSSTC